MTARQSGNEIVKALVFVMCLMVANTGLAAKGDVILGPVVAVKRTTTLNLEKLLNTCARNNSSTAAVVFECNVADELAKPTDVYPLRIIRVAEKDNKIGNVGINVGGGQGVTAFTTHARSLEDAKRLVTELFEENQLDGKEFEFYVHVLDKK